MDERVSRIAALANIAAFDEAGTRRYADAAPHVKHESLRMLYGNLVVQVLDVAKRYTATPKVLDLGAGEGSVTLPSLELGAKVVAVDISPSQLEALRRRCERFGDRLEVRCESISDTLKRPDETYDQFEHRVRNEAAEVAQLFGLETVRIAYAGVFRHDFAHEIEGRRRRRCPGVKLHQTIICFELLLPAASSPLPR